MAAVTGWRDVARTFHQVYQRPPIPPPTHRPSHPLSTFDGDSWLATGGNYIEAALEMEPLDIADWLRYAWGWVRETDASGYLQMPGSRTLRSPRDGKRWYYANKPSPAVPDGLGDEEAIRAIWTADSARK